MSEVYYLKYRPQKISQLDLDYIREQLMALLTSKSMPHALLFSGPKGLGKTSAARIVAKVLNCERPKSQPRKNIEPCNKCEVCQSIIKGTALDLIEIDAASNRGIDDVRELKEKIKLAPSSFTKKVYVIDEVHMLTKEAFNALLKTLEEPPEHAFFILCTTELHKLPETIISRCQRFDFTLATEEEIIRSLKRIVKGEELRVSPKVLNLIAKKAESSFRDASKILQQLSFQGKIITEKQARIFLLQQGDSAEKILLALSLKNQTQALKLLDQAVKKGFDLKDLIRDILEKLRQFLLIKYQVAEEQTRSLDFNITEIQNLISLFDQAGRQLKGAVIPQLPLELAIINFKCKEQNAKSKIEIKSSKLKYNKKRAKINDQDNLNKWQEVLGLLKKDNHSLEALLKSTEFKQITDNKLIVEVFYEFHKNKLMIDDYVALVEKRIKDVFGRSLKVKYRLKPDKISGHIA